MARDDSMVPTHNLPIWSHDNRLEARCVPVERPILHRIDHCIDLIPIKMLLALCWCQPTPGEIVCELLTAS